MLAACPLSIGSPAEGTYIVLEDVFAGDVLNAELIHADADVTTTGAVGGANGMRSVISAVVMLAIVLGLCKPILGRQLTQ
jgi:hypothetical protein